MWGIEREAKHQEAGSIALRSEDARRNVHVPHPLRRLRIIAHGAGRQTKVLLTCGAYVDRCPGSVSSSKSPSGTITCRFRFMLQMEQLQSQATS